ncbi:hypothetical protein BDZ85DRAFT_265288 [Elsinoe ampelina]|uniref:SNF2 N-terminal domain-containing protein n=1 Tax=Elsinoe ampelina TaxID=302913 RepID=A0A6A6G763_9PEZI|nr:hypothetical protein BDZ85DRAFT_265288 [Elsinoe ampelina]
MRSNKQQIKFHEQEPLDEAENINFNTPLRDYQCKAVAMMLSSLDSPFRGCILGDSMGLGKTIQSIAAMWLDRFRPGCASLIICPKSLIDQ